MKPLGKNLGAMVDQAEGYDQATSEPTDTTLVESIPVTSTASSSSRST